MQYQLLKQTGEYHHQLHRSSCSMLPRIGGYLLAAGEVSSVFLPAAVLKGGRAGMSAMLCLATAV
jgi:hypothetical protein